jgi:hypothetical protein
VDPQAATQLCSVAAWGRALLALIACVTSLLPAVPVRATRFHHQAQPCHDAAGEGGYTASAFG